MRWEALGAMLPVVREGRASRLAAYCYDVYPDSSPPLDQEGSAASCLPRAGTCLAPYPRGRCFIAGIRLSAGGWGYAKARG